MSSLSLDKRVEKIKGDTKEINRLLEEYKPFIASCTEKVAGRYVRYGEDDELSIAMIAFTEAVNAYDSSRGGFLSFASNVIRRRIIDYYRKENRHGNIISMSEYAHDDEAETDVSKKEALEKFETDKHSEYRRMEVIQLRKELSEWGITFNDLVKCSPGQKRTRDMSRRIIRFIISQQDIIDSIKQKKILPVSQIEKSLGISRKKIERMRKYIIAALLVETGDYSYIKEYVSFQD